MTGLGLSEEELVRVHERLVWSVAARFAGRAEREDLFQLGAIGLLKAARSFDAARGLCFSTFAVPHIAGEMRRHLRDDGPVKVSRGLRTLSARAAGVRASLYAERGEEPRLSEVAQALGVTAEELAAAELATDPPRSLQEEPVEGRCLADTLSDGRDLAQACADRVDLARAMEDLTREERAVLRLRYGSSLTQVQTARLLGISQVQVSRREKSALQSLRARL